MKKYFKHLSMAAVATLAFAACEEVPELPYGPGTEDGDTTAVVVGNNLLENGDFETWESSEPAYWKSTTTASSATLTQSSDAHSGTYAVLVQGDEGYNKRLAYKEIVLKAGTYYITFYAKAASDTEASVRPGYVGVLADGKADSQNYMYGSYINNINNTEWTEVKHEFTLDAQKTINLVIMNPKSTASDVLIDDYSLTTANGGLVEEGGSNDDNVEDEIPDSLLQTSTIAQVLAGGEGKRVKVKATAVATYARGFLLNDGTGYILTYLGEDKGYVVGDVVTIIGNVSMYAGLLQFPKESIVEKVGTAEVTHPAPTTWDGATMDAYLTAPSVNYVEYTGMLNISGYYYNIEVEGASTAVGSISYPAGAVADAAATLDGKQVVVTGYSIGVSSDKYVNTMALSITAAEGGDESGEQEDAVDTLSVAQAIELNDGSKQWVKGYIVGSVPGQAYEGATFTADGASETNLLIADTPDCTEPAKCMPVQLPKGAIRENLNLKANPTNLGQPLTIYGQLTTYFKVPGIKSPSQYQLGTNAN